MLTLEDGRHQVSDLQPSIEGVGCVLPLDHDHRPVLARYDRAAEDRRGAGMQHFVGLCSRGSATELGYWFAHLQRQKGD
jgi:hypothetical protein